MFESPVAELPEADAPPVEAPCDRPGAPCLPRPGRVRPEDVDRFVRDPMAFASRAGAPTPEAFVKAYLEGLERRLADVVGAPRDPRHRLATLTAQSVPAGDLLEAVPGDGGGELDRAPRMGPVVVACAVVQAAAAVVAAGAAVYMAMNSRRAR
jgi:hypothetical protein